MLKFNSSYTVYAATQHDWTTSLDHSLMRWWQKSGTTSWIMEVTTTVAPVTQAQSFNNTFLPTPDSSELTELRALTQRQARQIQTLTDQLRAFTRNQPQRNDNQHFGRRRSRSRNQPGSNCYYHQRFGEKARKCESPCSYQQSTPSPSGNEEARL